MNKNNIILTLLAFLVFAGLAFATADRALAQAAPAVTAKKSGTTVVTAPVNPNAPKKKIKIDYEGETVTGGYDVPDASFINSRRMIKYKELFNKRTNFIEEIDANKGLFNEY